MRKSIRQIAPILSAGAAAILLALALSGEAPIQRPYPPGVENPVKRVQWEILRLHDPKTGRIPDGIRMRELVFAATLPTKDQVLAKSPAMARLLATDWRQRGPYNVGGRTRALAIDLDNENIMLAGGASGGMWRSMDAGRTWNRSSHPMQHPTVSCLAQDARPGKRNVWYYGTGEFYGSTATIGTAKYSGEGIFKSVDGGISWTQLPSTVEGLAGETDSPFDYVWNIVTDPSNQSQDEVYAAVHNGIMRSMDGGATWAYVLGSNTSRTTFSDVAITGQGIVYATVSFEDNQRGLWRSEDGVNWSNITPDTWPFSYYRVVIGIAPSNDNIMYFLGETPGTGRSGGSSGSRDWHSIWKYTYRQGDGTGTNGIWENRSDNLPRFDGQLGGFRSQQSYDLVIKVKPDDENAVFIGGTNLFRSTDGFASDDRISWIGGYKSSFVWMDFSYPNHHPDQHSMLFLPSNPSVLVSGNDGGIHRTDNCLAPLVEWTPLNNGYLTTQLYALAIDHGTSGDNTLLAGMQDNSTWMTRSDDPNTQWVQVGPGDGAFCAIADGGSAHYVSSQGGRIYRVGFDQNGGLEKFARIDPQGGPGFLFINPFEMDPADTRILYHASGGNIWRNTDPTVIPLDSSQTAKNTNWRRLNTSGLSGTISAIGISTASPRHQLYCGTTNGAIYGASAVNTGTTALTQLTTDDLPNQGYVSCIAVDPADGDRALLVYSNYGIPSLFYTADGGTSWKDVSGNLEERPDGSGNGPSCRWAAILHHGGQTIYYVGTSTGLYSATQPGQWAQEGESTIGKAVVNMVRVRQSDGYIVVGTHGNGVFSAKLGSSSVRSDAVAADAVQLLGVAPNPMRETATIRFSIPKAGAARLALFDAVGRQVHVLLEKPLPAGTHEIPFNLGDVREGLPSGAYRYRLEFGGVQKTGQVTVVR